jgi:DNA-binding NarL/FixJ family response regulator
MLEKERTQEGSLRVLIVEPQTIFAPHLAFLATLAGAMEISMVPAAAEGAALDDADLIFVDPDYLEGDAFEVIAGLARASARAAICVLTGEHAPGRSLRFQRAGATAVVSKDASDGELVQALRLCAEHRPYTDVRVDAA